MPMRFVCEISRHSAQPITNELAKACDQPDDRRARAERTEKWADNSARTFIGKISEEVRDADDDNELKCRSAFHLTTNRHELTRIGRAHHSVRAATSTTKRGKAIRHSDFVIVAILAYSGS